MFFSGRTKLLFAAVAVLIAAAVAVLFLFRAGGSDTAAVTAQTAPMTDRTVPPPVSAIAGTTAAKQDNQGNYEPPAGSARTTPPAPGLPADVSQLQKMSASVTAVLSVSDDSIDVSGYVQGPGYFTVEQQDAGAWRVIRENVYYPGTGGLAAVSLAPGEQSVTLRLLGIAGGRYVSVSAAVTVSRAEVVAAGGIKTYTSD